MTAKPDQSQGTAAAQLRAYIDRIDPKNQKLIRSLRAAVRKRFPTANELVYDYSHSLVISYSPTDRGIDAVVAISARSNGVSLYFNQGPRLPDPKGLLMGSGKQTRFIPVQVASHLAHPDVEALITATIDRARVPLPSKGKGNLIIKSGGAKKPLRRSPST